MEELSSLGARKSICPYYASRSAQPGADLILLPYSALLSKVGILRAARPIALLKVISRRSVGLPGIFSLPLTVSQICVSDVVKLARESDR